MSNLKTQNEALADLILGILIFGILVVFVGLFVARIKQPLCWVQYLVQRLP